MRSLIFSVLTFSFLSSSIAHGQNFTFSPSSEVYTSLEPNQYVDTQVNIDPNSTDTYDMSWRMVGNTCPATWDVVLCDWSECYTYLPNNGDMDPIYDGQTGLIKLTVNPFETPGSGYIRFWIFPTGNMNDHVDLYFYFETTLTVLPLIGDNQPQITYSSQSKQVNLINCEPGNYFLISGNGQVVDQFFCSSLRFSFPLGALPTGIYFLTDRKRAGLKLIVQ